MHLAFIAILAVDTAVRERGVGRAVSQCAVFLLGAVLTLLPWLIYFGANGAWSDFTAAYLSLNDLKSLLSNTAPLYTMLTALGSAAIHNPAPTLMLCCGIGYLIRRAVRHRWTAHCTALCVAFVCAGLLAYWDGERYRFSPLAVAAFVFLSAGPVAKLLTYTWKRQQSQAMLLAVAGLICVLYGCVTNDNLPCIGYPKDELPQTKFASYISENGGGSLLMYSSPDDGFYLAADTLPESTAFSVSVAGTQQYKYYETLYSAMEAGEAQWLVARIKGDSSAVNYDYVYVMSASSKYDCSTSSGEEYTYSLYRYDPEAAQNEADTETDLAENEDTEYDVTNDIIS